MKSDTRVLLSTLWIFAVLNYLYADVITLMDSSALNEIMTGVVGGMHVSQGFLFIGAILMETAIVMVLLSRFLNYSANRWANIISGAIHTFAVSASMFVGTPKAYYLLFGTIEIATTVVIIWLAWRWRE